MKIHYIVQDSGRRIIVAVCDTPEHAASVAATRLLEDAEDSSIRPEGYLITKTETR